jgi:putative heme-binding domain-containing protein
MKSLFALFVSAIFLQAAPTSLFDGKTLDGWEVRAGEEKWWKVEDGVITGGSLTEKLPFNSFLASKKSYANFDLSFKIRLVKGEGFINSGMQVRSERLPDVSEMRGYQVDAGIGFWGDLYDESRRNKAIAKAPAPMAKDWEWNQFRIRCDGPRIQTWINGKPVLDYVEKDPSIPLQGRLGLQAHSGGKFLVQIKEVSITELPSTDGRPKTPEEQHTGFTVPAGYVVELVASEEQGVEKPITVTWDRHGRMWTMTATEYPVDANENEALARDLFKRGGKDRVLVFDDPSGPLPLTPRVFADGLAIPLGLLPVTNGALVQYGTEIRHYQDEDSDGKADRFETILEGFGIQDSHLFVHQFERAPGGWIYLAQGAFNSSEVKRPGGLKFHDGSDTVPFRNCKLGRFRPDGSAFEALTAGPYNIWGLVISRNGETFLQEANDLGYPVAEFAPGLHFVMKSSKLRPDAPALPQSTPRPLMGGTGLSGLALAEDRESPFNQGRGEGSVFYVVNPITSRIQTIHLTRDADGHYLYQKGEDFLLSADPSFRPIAAHFGPDGFLYVVDWYNKIISHNEVPRSHPDRDKTRGRIWRIRHESQKQSPIVDLAKASGDELIVHLGGPSARISSQAWQEIVDRKATDLKPRLNSLVKDSSLSVARRLAALWAIEGLGTPNADLLASMAASSIPELRYEAVRVAGEQSLPENDFLAVAGKLDSDPNFRVRAGVANAIRAHQKPTAGILAVAARLGRPPITEDTRSAYDRNFERYIARWAMSLHPVQTEEMLDKMELTTEARLLAVRSLPDSQAAARMMPLLPMIQRPLTADEIELLGGQIANSSVLAGLDRLLSDSTIRESILRTMTQLDPKVTSIPTLRSTVATAARKFLEERRTEDRLALVIQLTRLFRLSELSGEVETWLANPTRTEAETVQGVGTLREIGGIPLSKFRPYLDHPAEAVRSEAISGLGGINDTNVVTEFKERWPQLSGSMRALAITAMTSNAAKAEVFAKSLASGDFQGTNDEAIEKIILALGPSHPAAIELLKSQEGLLHSILRMTESGRVMTKVTLKGPFTIETWIKLDPGITEKDNLLGRKGGQGFNFFAGKLRVYGGKDVGDLITASRPAKALEWLHCAITRDAENRFVIYLDGERDAATGKEFAGDFPELNIGEGYLGTGTAAAFSEFRIWDRVKTAEEIRRDMHTRMEAEQTANLRLRVPGGQQTDPFEGDAKVSLARDFPPLVTPAEAAALEEKFSRFRHLANLPGDTAKGRQLAQVSCMICHQIGNEGNAIGPNLSGAGAMGVESLLRNILTPNAQLESGYYRHDVKLRDGSLMSGFLASETPDAITLKQIGADERVIPRSDIATHDISKRSLMPEGLIDGLDDTQVTDLFHYLKSLR